MTRIGRKPKGPALVDGLECSDTARERLRQILRATSGEATVAEVCAELGIGESRFHQLRDEVLQAAAECLEPRPAGRPAKPVGPSERRISELERCNRELTRQLEVERLRSELALMKSAAAGPAGVKKTRIREALPAVSPSNPPATRTGGDYALGEAATFERGNRRTRQPAVVECGASEHGRDAAVLTAGTIAPSACGEPAEPVASCRSAWQRPRREPNGGSARSRRSSPADGAARGPRSARRRRSGSSGRDAPHLAAAMPRSARPSGTPRQALQERRARAPRRGASKPWPSADRTPEFPGCGRRSPTSPAASWSNSRPSTANVAARNAHGTPAA